MTDKKTVIFSANSSWNIYNFRLGAMRALRDAGHNVVAVAPRDDYTGYIEDEGFDFYELRLDNDGTNPIKDSLSFFEYFKIYSKIKPDLIFHYTIKPCVYGGFAAGLLGLKSVSIITGLGYAFINNTIISKIACFLYRASLKHADEVWFQNSDDFGEFVRLGIIDTTKKVDILPGSGVNTDKFCELDNTNNDGKLRFLLIGRVLWDKGIGEYIEAAKSLKLLYPEAEFALLGSLDVKNPKAIQKDTVQQWVDEGIINYLGVCDDVRPYIASCDCVVLPSYREGVPRSLLEAASMKKPIVATDVPGCKEIVVNGVNGFLCKPRDVADLAKKMEMVMSACAEKRRQMGKAGRKMAVEMFDEKIVIQKYKNILSSI